MLKVQSKRPKEDVGNETFRTAVAARHVVRAGLYSLCSASRTTSCGKRSHRRSSPTPEAEAEAEETFIEGFPTTDENEAKTAQAAFDAADKGKPDPAWAGKEFTIGVYSAGQRGAISGPLYFWRPKFEELTGATYDIVEIPFAELREKIFTDFQTGAGNLRCHHQLLQLLR